MVAVAVAVTVTVTVAIPILTVFTIRRSPVVAPVVAPIVSTRRWLPARESLVHFLSALASAAETTSQLAREPIVDCPTSLDIDYHSSSINLPTISLFESGAHVALPLVFDKAVASWLPIKIFDHCHFLHRAIVLKLAPD